MTRNDRAALMQAMEMCRAESPERAAQLDHMLRDDGWEKAARFAASCCQSESLHLFPWQEPPCWGDSERCDPDAKKLMEQMLAAGVSKWHPDPLTALAGAKRRSSS